MPSCGVGQGESFSLLIPGVQGYGLHIAQQDDEQYHLPKLSEKSNVANFFVEKLNAPEDQAANYAMQQSGSIYWGGQPFTNGPVYLGAIICFLFILGMFLHGKHKWWILAASVLYPLILGAQPAGALIISCLIASRCIINSVCPPWQ